MIRIVWILWILCTVPQQFLFSLFKLNIINCIHSWIHLRDTREWNKIRRIILKKEKKKKSKSIWTRILNLKNKNERKEEIFFFTTKFYSCCSIQMIMLFICRSDHYHHHHRRRRRYYHYHYVEHCRLTFNPKNKITEKKIVTMKPRTPHTSTSLSNVFSFIYPRFYHAINHDWTFCFIFVLWFLCKQFVFM